MFMATLLLLFLMIPHYSHLYNFSLNSMWNDFILNYYCLANLSYSTFTRSNIHSTLVKEEVMDPTFTLIKTQTEFNASLNLNTLESLNSSNRSCPLSYLFLMIITRVDFNWYLALHMIIHQFHFWFYAFYF